MSQFTFLQREWTAVFEAASNAEAAPTTCGSATSTPTAGASATSAPPLLPEDKLGTMPRTAVAEGELVKNNLPDVLARWAKRNDADRERPRTAQSFCVSKAGAPQGYDLSLNRYKEVVYEAVEHGPPNETIAELASLEEEIQRGMNQLVRVL